MYAGNSTLQQAIIIIASFLCSKWDPNNELYQYKVAEIEEKKNQLNKVIYNHTPLKTETKFREKIDGYGM